MKVGDYVRIKNKVGCCYIGKIYNINDYREPSTKYCIDIQAKDFVFIGEEAICKSSPNIIDLLFDDEAKILLNYIENWNKIKDYIEIKRDEYSNEDNEWWFINRVLEYMKELESQV